MALQMAMTLAGTFPVLGYFSGSSDRLDGDFYN